MTGYHQPHLFDNNICFLEFAHCLLSHSPSRLSHLLAYIVISGSVGEEKGNISLEESHECFYLDVVTDGKLNGTHLENCSPLNSTIKMVWRLTPNKALMIRDATFPFGIRCTCWLWVPILNTDLAPNHFLIFFLLVSQHQGGLCFNFANKSSNINVLNLYLTFRKMSNQIRPEMGNIYLRHKSNLSSAWESLLCCMKLLFTV